MDEAQEMSTEQASDPGTGEYRLNWQLVHRDSRAFELLVLNATETEAKDEAARYSYRLRRFVEVEQFDAEVVMFDNDGYRLGQ
jgi:hypothetical protein